MVEYDKIEISEGIDVNKTNEPKEREICHYWCFKDIGFRYEPYLRNGCHDLNDVAIFMLKEVFIEFNFSI